MVICLNGMIKDAVIFTSTLDISNKYNGCVSEIIVEFRSISTSTVLILIRISSLHLSIDYLDNPSQGSLKVIYRCKNTCFIEA